MVGHWARPIRGPLLNRPGPDVIPHRPNPIRATVAATIDFLTKADTHGRLSSPNSTAVPNSYLRDGSMSRADA